MLRTVRYRPLGPKVCGGLCVDGSYCAAPPVERMTPHGDAVALCQAHHHLYRAGHPFVLAGARDPRQIEMFGDTAAA